MPTTKRTRDGWRDSMLEDEKLGEPSLSHLIYIAIYAHTGKWRIKKLPQQIVDVGKQERARHKSGERCMGCEFQTFDFVWGNP